VYDPFNVKRQAGDWPEGLDAAGIEWLQLAVRRALALGPQSLDVLVGNVNVYASDNAAPEAYRRGGLDYTFACVERAARSVGEHVWRLSTYK
jgi:hypothetical protein